MRLRGVRLLLIDGPNLIRRIHAAVPAVDRAEKIDQSVTSSLHSLARALNRHQPTHVLCAFESEGPTWRHERYPDYKKDRPPMPDELRQIFSTLMQKFTLEGVEAVQMNGMEADDIIASIAVRAAQEGAEVTILSTDTGQAQLLRPGIQQYDHFKQQAIDAETIQQRFGVRPQQLVDYFALVGDSSHSLPGVSGIGAKTAVKLLNQYTGLEAVIAAAEEIGGRNGENLLQQAEQARLVKQLLTLRMDQSLGIPLKAFRYNPRDSEHR